MMLFLLTRELEGLSEQVMTPGLLRAYFLIVLLLLLNRLTSFWTSTKPLSRKESTWPMKMREQMLLPVMILAVVYSLLWLPVLVVRTVELDHDLSSSMLTILWGFHCYTQERCTSYFLTALVTSTFIYFCSKKSGVCSRWWALSWTCGLYIPMLVNEVLWHTLSPKDWGIMTIAVYYNHTFSYEILDVAGDERIDHRRLIQHGLRILLGEICHKIARDTADASVVCRRRMDEEWVRLVMGEWAVTVVVAVVMTCCVSQATSAAPRHDPENKSSFPTRVKCVTETCSRVFEMVCASAVLWAILLRPACALYLYFTHWKVWSCLLDVPTHCFLIVIVIIVPREIERYTDEEDREYQAVGDCSDDDDVRPIWQTNHNFNEKGVYNDDVDPWWETKETSGQLPAGTATNFTHPVMTSEDVKLVAEYNERCLLVTVEAPTRTLWEREEDDSSIVDEEYFCPKVGVE
ncbi:uncharacterized protein LOC121866474 isoform X2 [Homarus americanus]|uniref:uncharacterized protein LOC121866474 isoform X2 n=1 Tax=Homarus americanus TaxID=6706 RepID=UPI001C493816|nr:uncharacterized protein LOC121866474 isoform X2 [Homarus americanus]